jgi:hypothetical protein
MNIMTAPSKNKVYLYNAQDEIEGKSAPYAVEDAERLEQVISRFVAWARILPMSPDVSVECRAAYMELAIDLQALMKVSRENRLYPRVVLPMGKYFYAKMLWATTQAAMMQPAFAEMMERENRLWEEGPA